MQAGYHRRNFTASHQSFLLKLRSKAPMPRVIPRLRLSRFAASSARHCVLVLSAATAVALASFGLTGVKAQQSAASQSSQPTPASASDNQPATPQPSAAQSSPSTPAPSPDSQSPAAPPAQQPPANQSPQTPRLLQRLQPHLKRHSPLLPPKTQPHRHPHPRLHSRHPQPRRKLRLRLPSRMKLPRTRSRPCSSAKSYFSAAAISTTI